MEIVKNNSVILYRDKYIGGSDMPYILGLADKDIIEFAKEKLNIIPKTFTGNQYTYYGSKMEKHIRDYISRLYKCNYKEATKIDDERGLRGNCDGLALSSNYPLIEIKTFGKELDVNYYEPQCRFYMEMFNVPSCVLIGYKRPNDFFIGMDPVNYNDYDFNLDFNPENIVIHVFERDNEKWEKYYKRILDFKEVMRILKEENDEERARKVYLGENLINAIDEMKNMLNEVNKAEQTIEKFKKMKEKVNEEMEEKLLNRFKNSDFTISRITPSVRISKTIDFDELLKKDRDLYKDLVDYKETKTKGYIKVTINNK